MSTAAKVAANRRNARKSTGPRTPTGKNHVRLNALKHGLRAESICVTNENTEDFDAFRETMMEEYEAVGERELQCVDRISRHAWRMQRCARVEPAMFEKGMINIFETECGGAAKVTPEMSHADSLDIDAGIGQCYHHFGKDIDLHRRYEIFIERQYYRAIDELDHLQHRRMSRRIGKTMGASTSTEQEVAMIATATKCALEALCSEVIDPPSNPMTATPAFDATQAAAADATAAAARAEAATPEALPISTAPEPAIPQRNQPEIPPQSAEVNGDIHGGFVWQKTSTSVAHNNSECEPGCTSLTPIYSISDSATPRVRR